MSRRWHVAGVPISVADLPEWAVLVTDDRGGIVSRSGGAEVVLACPLAGGSGRTLADLLTSPVEPPPSGRQDRASSGPAVTTLVRADGTEFDVAISRALRHDETGRAAGTISVIAVRSREAGDPGQWLQVLDGASRMAGAVAHDFNNYITAIRGYLTFLREDLAAGDALRADVESIQAVTERAAELTGRLLELSRYPAAPDGTTLDLNAAIDDMLIAIRTWLGDGIEVIIEPGAGLPEVAFAAEQLDHVLRRLALNARAAMPEGGRFVVTTSVAAAGPTAGVAGPADGSSVELSISDSGTGIPAAALPHVFQPFFSTKSGKAAGLGLTSVYRVVHQAGGSIRIASEPGAGTTIVITLPAAACAPS